MAKPVSITITHELGRERALERIRSGFDRVGNALGFGVKLDQRWDGDTLHFSARALAQTVSGTLVTDEKSVEITLVLPAFLAGMAEAISGKVRKESTLLLEKK
jgi:hypothetical protein